MGGAETLDLSGSLNGDWTFSGTGFLKAYRKKDVVTIRGANLINNDSNMQYTALLPVGWRPALNLSMPAGNTTDDNWAGVYITTNGQIQLCSPTFATWYTKGKIYSFSVTFVTA